MKLCLPIYYKNFHCIANKCKDSCCSAGWEIDIDENTEKFYKNIDGDFGEKLKNNIVSSNESGSKCFALDKNGVCPFFNKDKLCDIYINLGENHLCEICTEHPRYYEWFNNIKEGGIGLCCEEAARIILSYNDKFKTYETTIEDEEPDYYDEELYEYLSKSRLNIISYLDNKTNSLNTQMKDLLWYAYTIQQDIDSGLLDEEEIFHVSGNKHTQISSILELFLTLEPSNDTWILYLKNCIKYANLYEKNVSDFEQLNQEIFKYLHNIAVYFIWRYFMKSVFDEDVLSKVKLMVVSVAILKFLFYCKWTENGILTFEDCIEITKKYSEEIEYSEENLEKLADASYEKDEFSTENLLGLFK